MFILIVFPLSFVKYHACLQADIMNMRMLNVSNTWVSE